MPGRGVFVTGTDTEVGKTRVSLALMQSMQQQGHRVLGMKPVAAGCELTSAGLVNEDALLLMRQSSIDCAYEYVNPYAFEPPIAPHIAAAQVGEAIQLERIEQSYDALAEQADWVVVEGVGGWAVPLSDTTSVADIPRYLQLPVVLVVGLRLGCINHALLSAAAIEQSGCRLLGWAGSAVDADYLQVEATLATLRERLPAACLGVLGHQDRGTFSPEHSHLDVSFCLN